MTANIESDDFGETCTQCGFDSALYNRADTVSSQSIIPAVLRAATDGLSYELLQRRPDPTTWSIAERIDHVREIAFGNRFVIESALAEPGIDLGRPPSNELAAEPREIELDRTFEDVVTEYNALRDLLGGLSAAEWDTRLLLGDQARTVEYFARHVLHDGLHHLAEIGRIRHAFGHGATTEVGQVAQLNLSTGGVPKRSVDAVSISSSGLDGDKQNDRRHHGRPLQAVCLWSADVIRTLSDEGHPIAPGCAGENVTITGVDWAGIGPGSRVDVGAVPMLVSAYAIPCAKNAQWFVDGEFNRILHDRHPGFSRLYAIPLSTGIVRTGDPVTVEAPITASW